MAALRRLSSSIYSKTSCLKSCFCDGFPSPLCSVLSFLPESSPATCSDPTLIALCMTPLNRAGILLQYYPSPCLLYPPPHRPRSTIASRTMGVIEVLGATQAHTHTYKPILLSSVVVSPQTPFSSEMMPGTLSSSLCLYSKVVK